MTHILTATAANPASPADYDRRILLVACGLSPQVVTETLYALTQTRQPAFIPTEIHLITTAEGAKRASLALLSDKPGGFHKLCADYGLPAIAFDESNFHVVRNPLGEALNDIRTPADNEHTANLITNTVRQFTADSSAALHVSIAGGRKTMGFYLGYVLSLLGREQDRLSHVLVSEPFESSWDFFYPTPYSQVITTRDNNLADTVKAEVTLADIPFVRLRHGFTTEFLQQATGFSESVETLRSTLEPPRLVFNRNTHELLCSGRRVHLAPRLLTLYYALLQQRLGGGDGIHWKDNDFAETLCQAHMTLFGKDSEELKELHGLIQSVGIKDWFDPNLSRLRKSLKDQLGSLARYYTVETVRRRPVSRYQLTGISPAQITLLG